MGAGEPMTAVVGGERAGAKRLLTVLVWSVGAISMTAFAAAWLLAARNRDLFDISAGFSPDRFMVAYPVVGALLASRRRSNPIGWLLLGVGMVTAARALAGEYALQELAGPSHPPSAVWAAWFVGWSLTLLFPGGLLTFLLLLFPGGQPLTARWWAVGWAAIGLGAINVVVTWLDPGTIAVDGLPSVPNPTGLRGWIRYNAERVVAQFSVQLREEVDLDVLGADLLGVVHHVLAPTHLGLWLSGVVSPSTAPGAGPDDSSPSTADPSDLYLALAVGFS